MFSQFQALASYSKLFLSVIQVLAFETDLDCYCQKMTLQIDHINKHTFKTMHFIVCEK